MTGREVPDFPAGFADDRATCDRLYGATDHSGAAHIRGLDGEADLSSASGPHRYLTYGHPGGLAARAAGPWWRWPAPWPEATPTWAGLAGWRLAGDEPEGLGEGLTGEPGGGPGAGIRGRKRGGGRDRGVELLGGGAGSGGLGGVLLDSVLAASFWDCGQTSTQKKRCSSPR